MQMLGLILDVLPFLAFVWVSRKQGLKIALAVALGLGVLALIVQAINAASAWERSFFAVAFGLLLVCSALAYRQQKGLIFKLQPAILGTFIGLGMLIAFFGFSTPILLIAVQDLGSLLPSQAGQALTQEDLQPLLIALSRNLGFGFLVLSMALAWAALRLSDWWWLAWRIFGLYLMVFIVLVVSLISG